MQNRCCAIDCFLNNSSKAHAHWLATLIILRNFISLRHLLFTWKTHRGLNFHYARSHVNADNEVTSSKWNFTPKWNLEPVWVHFGSHVNVLLDLETAVYKKYRLFYLD